MNEFLSIPFHKYHALGNDYLVLDPKDLPKGQQLSPGQIQLICHRNYGIGSDGILWGPLFQVGKPIGLKIFNPDGSEAEKSGNGIRIFSQFLRDKGYVNENFFLETRGGQVKVEFLSDTPPLIRVDMGTVTFQSNQIPVSGPTREVVDEPIEIPVFIEAFQKIPPLMTCLSVGNPHCVIPLEEISEKLARQIGPHIENHSLFPNRINLQLLKILDRKNIQIEIWERGAGYTLASGSSSCAAASAAFRLGLVDSSVTVHMPGGKIGIDRTPEGHVLMTGPVTRIATGELDIHFLRTAQ